MNRLAIVIAATLSLITLACTAPNPTARTGRDVESADPDDDGAVGGDVKDGPVTDGGHSADSAEDDDAEPGETPTDDPSTCDGVSERPEVPACHGGTLEVATDGAIVCHWACVGLVEIEATVVESAPGCFALDDMICHECTERLPRSYEPAPRPCPDVVRLLW